PRLAAPGQRAERAQDLAIVDAAVVARAFHQTVRQPDQQRVALIDEALRHLHVREHGVAVYFIPAALGFVPPRLHQVRTIAGTIQRHLPLLAAAGRTDAPMHRRTEALLLAGLTNRTCQCLDFSLTGLSHLGSSFRPQPRPLT